MTDPNPVSKDEISLAPPDTLRGQLQRGRGRGFLRALQEDVAAVHAILLTCIIEDPRWDSQVEDRADYYARLALCTQLNLDPLEDYLRTAPHERGNSNAFLTIETLGRLAQLGSADAVRILRRYIGYGAKWDAALRELTGPTTVEATAGLAEVLCARFKTGAEMRESAVYSIFDPDLDALWARWSRTNPGIARLLQEARPAPVKSTEPPTPSHWAGLSVSELLAAVDARNQRHIEKLLLSRLQRADIDRYAAAFALDNPFAWRVAFACLAAMQQDPPFHHVIADRLVSYTESARAAARGGPGRHSIEVVLRQLPAAMILPVARRWFDSREWHLRLIGEGILEEHATPDDIQPVQAALAAALRTATPYNTDIYRVCEALEILARFPNIGALPEVEAVFLQSGYSFARIRATRALRTNSPGFFAATYAYECLWDCEEAAREIAGETVPLATPGARDRLEALAEDSLESELVRHAAAQRLAAGA